MAEAQSYDVVVVGAGFSGLYMLHRLRQAGETVRVYEAGPSVGGTWFWNRYPGARVDIESQEYAYSFSPELDAEWQWTERYAAQPELLAYLNHVADRFDLRGDIQLETRVTAAVWDEAARRWTVTTDRGDQVIARHVVMATGCLSIPKEDAELPGADTFRGPSWHTGRWPEDGVDFTGKTVAVIGTGSSAIQADPADRRAGHARHGLPAHAQLQRAGPQRPDRSGRRGRLGRPPCAVPQGGARYRLRHPLHRDGRAAGARGQPRRSARRPTRRAGATAASRSWAPSATWCWTRPPTPPPPSSSAPRSARSSRTRRSPRSCRPRPTRSAPSGSASTPATTRPSTATTSASSTSPRSRSSGSRRPG